MAEGPQLSELQVDVMRVLWTQGEVSVAAVREQLAATRGLALTTVATVLTRLEKRGLVSRRKDGNHYLYRAAVTEGQVRSSMVGELRDSLFQGDVSSLVSHLLQDSEISAGDLEKVRALIDKKARRTEGDGDE